MAFTSVWLCRPIAAALIGGAVIALSACSSGSTTAHDGQSQPPASVSRSATSRPATPCDVVREAFLTGTPDSITAALGALQADTAADGKAREAAQQYLDQTDADVRDMDKKLIQVDCEGAGTKIPDGSSGAACAAAREALLTGTPEQISSVLTALKNDTSAPEKAREAADAYLTEKDAGVRQVNKVLLQTDCVA